MNKGPLLVMWSGGLDSTLVMYNALKHGREVRAHHIRLTNKQGRADVEAQAVERIAAWFQREGLTNFRLTHSTHDYGDLPYRVLDVKVWSWWIGAILAYEDDITQVASSAHLGSFSSERTARRQSFVRQQMPLLSGRQTRRFEWVTPLERMTKAQIIEALPGELLDLCWYCRTPKAGEPCHECYTCKQVDDAQGYNNTSAQTPAEPAEAAAEPQAAPVRSASRKKWAEYAQAQGVDVDGLTKAQIIAAVEAL